MFLPRVIPVLLLKEKGLVKTVKFRKPKYIGDPINAVRILNDLKADELIFLDITASKERRTISEDLIRKIGDEAYMPFGVGGGISNIRQIENLLKAGAEKVVINTAAVRNPEIIKTAADNFGSQSIVVCIDAKQTFWHNYIVLIEDGKIKTKLSPVDMAKKAMDMGAGELIVNSVDRDGCMSGYDVELIKNITAQTSIPVVACGGAGNLEHFYEILKSGGAHAVAGGSIFVYHGPRNAVLINYPRKTELMEIFNRDL